MKITSFSIKRPITVFMGILIVLMFGAVSYLKLNIDMLPSFNLPMLMMMTQYSGAGPEEIEDLVTKPLEGVLATVGNVEGINSISGDGTSMLMIEFADGTDMDFASLEMREKIDMVSGMLPSGVGKPMIMKMDPNMMPIMSFALNIEGKGIEELSDFTEKTLKPMIERIDGVASVDIMGDSDNEIKIVVNQDKLAANGLTMNNITSALKSDNMNMPIGTIVEGSYDLLVRTTSKIDSIADVEDILITNREGEVFKLKDLATIVKGREAKDNYARLNGEDALIFSVQKESTANTVKVSNNVKDEIESMKSKIEGLGSTIVLDQAQFIEFAIDSVKMNAILGAILAVLVIFMFLKDVRSTIIMAVSIPISVVSTFIMVYFAGFTLNMISLGGIALGVGMLVDNSIVVIENIYRLRKEGKDSITAAIEGTKEVAMAISASTLTSICVFLPIVFVEGMASELFREMAFSVAFSLVSSLAVSFTLVPLLASRLFKEDTEIKENKTFEKIKRFYLVILTWSMNHKKTVMGVLVGIILFGGFIFTKVGLELFPAADQGVVSVKIVTPKGLNINSVNEIALEVVEKMQGIEGIESEAVMVEENGANISVMLKDKRKVSDKDVAREIRNKVSNTAGAKIEVVAMSGGISTGSSPLVIKVSGQDFDKLSEITDKIKRELTKVEGVIDIKSSNEKSSEEIRIIVDKEKAASYGLNNLTIAQAVQGSFRGINIDQIGMDDKNYDIVVSSNISDGASYSDLENITINTMSGGKIPLSDIAKIERGKGYSEIAREDDMRVVTVNAGVDGISLGDAVKEVKANLASYNLESGYKIQYGGEVEQMVDAFSQMALALIVAILLVYMIMAAQFESLLNPFIIMFTIPLAFVGAIFLLYITGVNIGITALIGFIMLSGIIVNNGIVLIDYINRLKEEGKSTREAILETGPVRLQPILMTALTTIMGLIPMAIGLGEGSELQLPLALTVIGGLTFSTLLTLIVIPVVYAIFDSLSLRIKRRKLKKVKEV
ncbi:efflux RND transporter permease subunit [uncultured Clostridium sp.]|uniref:efflux RND transporter permease subunit n=1 Tax=uncultured Clostridium sp. TaxID=59620 RepID=UPI00260F5A01|nr:efflux RND transporter permease subunit [uncultured Clostridium sp.]